MSGIAPDRVLLAPGRVFDGTGTPLVGHGVLVEDGQVRAVDRLEALEALGLTPEPHPGSTLLPGLVDSHVHLELDAREDHAATLAAWERDRDAGLLGLRALTGARAALAAGITTLRDCGASPAILAVRDALRDALDGPRLLVTGPPVTTRGGHCHWFGGAAETPSELRAMVARLCDAGVDAVKVMATGGIMTAASDPARVQFDAPAMRLVIAEAHRRGRPVVVHAIATAGIEHAFAAGADSIDHLSWMAPDGTIQPDPALIERIGAARQWCGVTTSGIVRRELDAGPDGLQALRDRLADKVALARAGARLHIHSDAGVRFTPVDRPDLSLRVAVAGGLSGLAALVAMTSAAAEAVGRGSEVGRIRAGARADLLLVHGDPLSDPAALREVRAVWRDGRRVVGALPDGAVGLVAA